MKNFTIICLAVVFLTVSCNGGTKPIPGNVMVGGVGAVVVSGVVMTNMLMKGRNINDLKHNTRADLNNYVKKFAGEAPVLSEEEVADVLRARSEAALRDLPVIHEVGVIKRTGSLTDFVVEKTSTQPVASAIQPEALETLAIQENVVAGDDTLTMDTVRFPRAIIDPEVVDGDVLTMDSATAHPALGVRVIERKPISIDFAVTAQPEAVETSADPEVVVDDAAE
jgi:hypothetical protein